MGFLRGRDHSEPPQNRAIVEAMNNVAVHDAPERRALLFQLLLDATLIVATPEAPDQPGVSRTAQPGEHLTLVTLPDEDGLVLPVFTSDESLSAWRPGVGGYVEMQGRDLFQLAAAGGTDVIVLDPGSATGGTILRHELEALSKGRLPLGKQEVFSESTEVRIGQPAELPPAELLEALRAALAETPLALRAFLFLMRQGDAAPEMCVGVVLDDAAVGDAERAAMRAIVDGAGNRSPDAGWLAFLNVTDGDWLEDLTAGAGVEIYRR